MSQDQKEIPKEEEKELDNNEIADKEEDKIEKSDSIVEDRFSPPQSSEEEINKEEEVIEIVETPFEENEEPVESTKLADVELEDFVPPPVEEREDFNLPEQKMKASTLKKTIQNIQNVQNKISSEWKKRADNSLSNHRKLNEAIVADIKKDLKFMASELGQATNAESEKVRSEFNNLSQKISQSNELNERVANETTENLIAEIDIALSDVNKNISMNIDKIVNNTATVLGNRRSDILGAKVEVENSITGELNGYRDESEKVISKFSDTSNSALTKMTNTAEETFDQLKNELQSTLNSFKNNSDTILTSFSDQNSDSFNRSKTAISEDIETSKTERISSLARANERASAASEDIKKKIDIKTQSFNNELIQNISDFTVIVEDLHKEGNTSMLELVDKSNVMLNDKIQELNNGISEGLNSVNSAATDSLNSTSDTIKNTINENNKLIETARSSALESLTSLKSENIVSTRQFQEDMRKSITEHLDTVKKEMIGIIDNFGSNHIDRATGASQQIEDNIS
ncbi:MAG: hypothetical protein GY870_15185, partial [archaeon]|nr:hypothetical protein [archaeon]